MGQTSDLQVRRPLDARFDSKTRGLATRQTGDLPDVTCAKYGGTVRMHPAEVRVTTGELESSKHALEVRDAWIGQQPSIADSINSTPVEDHGVAIQWTRQRRGHCRKVSKGRTETGSTLLDPEGYPAQDLIALYAWRWRLEVCLRDLKTTMGNGPFADRLGDFFWLRARQAEMEGGD